MSRIDEIEAQLASARLRVVGLEAKLLEEKSNTKQGALVAKAMRRVDGVNMRSRRQDMSMSLGELAEYVGCSRQALARYETSGAGIGDDTIAEAWATLGGKK